MQIFEHPETAKWPALILRPVQDNTRLTASVRKILDAVRTEGDAAVRQFSKQFDSSDRPDFRLETAEIAAAAKEIPDGLKNALGVAKKNIELFHRTQQITEPVTETMPGVICWRKSVGIETVGLYIPGGTAPLFSTVLMLGIPAVLAGCRRIVLCSPPAADGKLPPAIIYAASLAGLKEIYAVGGVQAVAAMAFGTDSIPKVDKIFGPGNQYVTCAKQLLQQDGMAIDMPAGPSEVAVYADGSANPEFVAADLLSQCEHGPDSQVMLVCRTRPFAVLVEEAMERQLQTLPRAAVARTAMGNSRAVILAEAREAMAFLNRYAPEHLILACEDAAEMATAVRNAGSVFLGHFTPESAGDYASGTNHTLPTNGYARAYSGVSVDSFVKKISFQQISFEGLRLLGPTVMEMASAEGLKAHSEAVRIRLEPPAPAGSK